MNKRSHPSIKRLFLIGLCAVVFVATGAVGALWLHASYARFQDEVKNMREESERESRTQIRKEVQRALHLIASVRQTFETEANKAFRQELIVAIDLLNRVPLSIDRVPGDELEAERLQMQPFSLTQTGERERVFVWDVQERKLLLPGPFVEQRSADKDQSVSESSLRSLTNALAPIEKQKQGMIEFSMQKQGGEMREYEAFVHRLIQPGRHWVVGVARGKQRFETAQKKKVLDFLAAFYLSYSDYIFVATWDGKSLLGPGAGQNVFQHGPDKAKDLMKVLIDKARKGGGFVQYRLPDFQNPETGKDRRKISFVAPIPDWEWYLGAGVLLDKVEEKIAKRHRLLKQRNAQHFVMILTVLIMVLVLCVWLSHIFSKRMGQDFYRFATVVSEAAVYTESIDEHSFAFREFTELASWENDVIAARRQSEEQLRESEERFRMLIEESPLAILVCDKQGVPILINRSFEAIFGYTLADLPNDDAWFQRAYPDPEVRVKLKADWQKNLERAVQDDEPFPDYQATVMTGYGTERVINFQTSLVGEYVVIVFHDNTEKDRLENELRQRQKMESIGQLAGGVAHDFNNQLGGIMGFAEVIQAKTEEEVTREYAERIVHAAQRAADLTSQLLAFARKGKYRMAQVEVNQLVNDVVKMLEHTVDPRIKVSACTAENALYTKGDQSQLQNVLLNLGLNARDAIKGDGYVVFRVAECNISEEALTRKQLTNVEPGRFVIVTVQDNGTGMSQELQERIFEPFFTTKEEGKGTGMGLAAVYGAVRSHKGGIHVDSTEGEGTVIEVFLPFITPQEQPVTEANQQADTNVEATLLLVDDEEVVRSVVAEQLRGLGYTVITCASGSDALTVIESKGDAVDLVLLDMLMPQMSGSELYYKIREMQPEMKVILISGFAADNQARELLDQGAVAFCSKPFRLKELRRLLSQALMENSTCTAME